MDYGLIRIINSIRKYNCHTQRNLAPLSTLNLINNIYSISVVESFLGRYTNINNIFCNSKFKLRNYRY